MNGQKPAVTIQPPSPPDQTPPPRPARLLQLGSEPVHIRLEPRPLDVKVNVFVGQGLHLVEHRGDVARHADLIALGMVGLSLLHGVLDVNGEGDGRTARTHPTGA